MSRILARLFGRGADAHGEILRCASGSDIAPEILMCIL